MSLKEFWEGGHFSVSPASLSSGIIFRGGCYYMLRCNGIDCIYLINIGRFLLYGIETENTGD